MKDWIIPIIFLLLGYLLDFTRPWIMSIYERSIFSSRKKRIESLLQEYRYVKSYKKDTSVLIIVVLRNLAYGLVLITIVLTLFILSAIAAAASPPNELPKFITTTVILVLGCMALLITVLLLREKIIRPIDKTLKFYSYTSSVMDKIEKLGGTLEEFDEIVKEVEEKRTIKKKQPRR